MKAEELVRQIEEKLGSVTVQPGVSNVGRVVAVADGIVRADGLSRAGYGELVEFGDGRRGLVMNLDEEFASLLVEGQIAINEGRMLQGIERTPEATTRTRLEDFLRQALPR